MSDEKKIKAKELTDEQKEKMKACKTAEELSAFATEENIELPADAMDMISGGVQAGLITIGGSGEFGPQKPDDPKPPHHTWL